MIVQMRPIVSVTLFILNITIKTKIDATAGINRLRNIFPSFFPIQKYTITEMFTNITLIRHMK